MEVEVGVKESALWVSSLLATSGAASGVTYEVTRKSMECRREHEKEIIKDKDILINFDNIGKFLRAIPKDTLDKLLKDPNKL